MGASIIHHLLRLPLSYFSKRPVGEVSSRISELEKIRSFLTGTALTVLLDAVFSVVYIAVMLIYSVPLTFAALGVLPLFVGSHRWSCPDHPPPVTPASRSQCQGAEPSGGDTLWHGNCERPRHGTAQ